MTQETYPANWDAIDEAKSQASEFLKLESGDKVRLRILTGPYAFGQIKYDKGEDMVFLNVPFNAQIPGYKPRAQYAFEVLLLDGKQQGAHKVWAAGQKIAEQLREIRQEWGDITKPDIVVKKEGKGLLTKWTATAAPTSAVPGDNLIPAFKLEEKITMATAEDLAKIPPAATSKQPKDALDQKISTEQNDFIGKLAVAKELTVDGVLKIIERKFNKNEIDELTRSEASTLIETLKAL